MYAEGHGELPGEVTSELRHKEKRTFPNGKREEGAFTHGKAGISKVETGTSQVCAVGRLDGRKVVAEYQLESDLAGCLCVQECEGCVSFVKTSGP